MMKSSGKAQFVVFLDKIFSKHQLPFLNGRPSTDLRARLVMNIAVTKLYHGKSEEAFGLLLKVRKKHGRVPSSYQI